MAFPGRIPFSCSLREEGVFRTNANSRTFPRRSIHGQVAHELAMRIMSGAVDPGDSLPTEETASSGLNVSRTAYREALKVLAAKGLVESRPKTGTRVRPRAEWNMLDPDLLAWSFEAGPSESFARSLFEMRQIVEPAAAELAAERATDAEIAVMRDAVEAMTSAGPDLDLWVAADLKLHLAILATTHNELLESFGYLIDQALAQSFGLSSRDPSARAQSLPFHVALFERIEARDPQGAGNAMRHLLASARQDLEEVISAGQPVRNSRGKVPAG